MNQQENINWDKIYRQLERDEADETGFNELNPEELEILLLAEETNMRLRGRTSAERFPVDAGWDELRDKYLAKKRNNKPQSIRKKLYVIVIAAASLICIAAPAWWVLKREQQVIEKSRPALAEVRITLPDGEQVNVVENQPSLTEENFVVNNNILVYKKETELPVDVKTTAINTLEVPFGKRSHIVLSDGSSIWLNAGSTLKYPTVFATDKREVTLEGEAYFDISHNASRPFVVHTTNVKVKVLGTSFGINTFGDEMHTILETGKVSMEAGQKHLVLKPGELGIFKAAAGSLAKTAVDTRAYTAWKDEQIYFDKATMREIADRLEREYDFEFVFENETLEKLHFTIDVMKTEDIKTLLDQIKFSHNKISFEVKDQKVYVKQR